MTQRNMNTQRHPDSTRRGDTLELFPAGGVTNLTADDILRRLEKVEVVYRDSRGWHVVPGEQAFFEIGLREDEFVSPAFRRELDKVKRVGVKIVIMAADDIVLDGHDPAGDDSLN